MGSVLAEIVLPETKPETEWVRGRALQKVSPTYRHSRLQSLMLFALDAWASGRGRVGVEWRFRVAPPGEIARPFVPDVAFLSYERLPASFDGLAQTPIAAPNVAVEVLSPGDRRRDVAHKTQTYLRAGTDVVVLVNPKEESIIAHDVHGTQTFAIGDMFTHPALPGFALDVRDYFARART